MKINKFQIPFINSEFRYSQWYKCGIKPLDFYLFTLIITALFSCTKKEEKIVVNTLFEKIPSTHSKIDFSNNIYEDEYMNAFIYEYFYNGAGIAVGDINNDGLDDIYFTSNLETNRLYLNKGELKFQDITKPSQTDGGEGWTTGTNMVDINNDGLLDIYVCKSGPFQKSKILENELYINKGLDEKGIPVFEEEAAKYGLNDLSYSIQSVFFDFDRDGDLDMYLMNHNPQTLKEGILENEESSKFSEIGDKFYINENGKYLNKTLEVGIFSNQISYGLGVGVSDLNLDGWPDLYISNDYEEHDYMYINQKNGTFKEVVKKATKHISNFSMGNDIADFDNDGYTDIMTLDMVAEDNYGIKTSMASMSVEKFHDNVKAGRHFQYMYNTLQKHTSYIDSTGTPFYSEIGQIAGISNTDWSWAPLFADFDNDGNKDLFITNGIKRDFRNKDFFANMQAFSKKNQDAFNNPEKLKFLISKTPNRPYKNYFYQNSGGLKFKNTSDIWLENNTKGYSNGAVYTDLDNDGDLDLVINNVDEQATVLKNNSNLLTNNNYLKLEFKGLQNNTKGIGTKAILYTNKGQQVYENYTVRGYLSSVSPKINIGIPKNAQVDSLKIIWPTGKTENIQIKDLNKTYTIQYDIASSNLMEDSYLKNRNSLFTQHNISTDFKHIENIYNDYKHQLLLPHKLSQFGPAIAIGDVNGDGTDDIYLGQSTGEASQLFIQNKQGNFIKKQTFTKDAIFEDVDAKFLDIDKDGDLDLYVASGGNEFKENALNYTDRLYENKSGKFIKREDLLPSNIHISSSKISVNDFNDDGYPDLFVGGRHTPHQYPSPTNSYILMNKKGVLVDVTESHAPELKQIGLVTDATWTDYDNDNDKDLLIVGEWMGPTLFENKNGTFTKIESTFLDSLSGWYNSVESVDLDNDGDDDYIIGNLGENYKYKANTEEPFEMYYHDFDENGSKDIVLGYYNFGKLYPVRGKECSSQQVPKIKKIKPTYHDFGSSTIKDIYGDNDLKSALHLSSYNFKSGILKNNGSGNFDFIPLPEMAQISSINDILIKDINNDAKKDIIMAGNLFTSEIETPRNDAGYGIVLLNNGDFNFSYMDTDKSGLFIPFDSKNINWIQIKNDTYLMSGNNNDNVSTFKLN